MAYKKTKYEHEATHKYLAIKNWGVYQTPDTSHYVKDYVNKEFDYEFSQMSGYCRYIYGGMCRLHARLARNTDNSDTFIARALNMIGTDRPHVGDALRTLISRNFLIPTNEQFDPLDKIREEEKRVKKSNKEKKYYKVSPVSPESSIEEEDDGDELA